MHTFPRALIALAASFVLSFVSSHSSHAADAKPARPNILFIIFDLEVAFLFPWAVALGDIGVFGFWSMMLFLGVLTVGFIYEWRKGALEWE